MILDKLLEKKDVQAYISWRLKVLAIELGKIPKIPNPRRRETAKRHINGRMDELRLMNNVINRGVKKDSMKMCERYWKECKSPLSKEDD